MKKCLIVLAMAVMSLCVNAQQVINVWPDGPADNNGHDNEAVLTVYTPAQGVENSGKAVVICPGGGYTHLAIDHEGHEIAKILAGKGVTAAVLKYRLPHGQHNIPADDARQAIRIVRNRAAEWGINPEKIGIAGFSAGGHLASTVLTHHKDSLSRPNFGVLFYPVVSLRPGITHDGSAINLLGDKLGHSQWVAEYSNDEKVDAMTPPTIFMLSSDDTAVHPDNSIRFFQNLVKQGTETEMHIYPMGGHGWGMRTSFPYHDRMVQTMCDWLDRR